MKTFVTWLLTIITVIIFAIVGIAIFDVRNQLPGLGSTLVHGVYALLYLVGALLVVSVILGSIVALRWVINFWYHLDYRDLGEFGTIAQRGKEFLELAPYAPKITDVSGAKVVDGTIATPRVDALGDVLEKGLIGVASEKFLFGYYPDNTPMFGIWDRVKSVIVAGMSGSGKTVTMVFLIVQMMLSKAAKLVVIDPHFNKPDGLTTRLKPLAAYGTFVHTDKDALEAIQSVKDELERRVCGSSYDSALLLVIDEYNRLASRNKEVFDAVKDIIEAIGQEGRGYGIYVILAGQIWQPSKSGGSSIINSIQSVYCHRLKRNQARFIVDGETAKLVEKLTPGTVFFSDANGDVEKLVIPEAKYRDAVTIKAMLDAAYQMLPGATSGYDQARQIPRHDEMLPLQLKPARPEATSGYGNDYGNRETTTETLGNTDIASTETASYDVSTSQVHAAQFSQISSNGNGNASYDGHNNALRTMQIKLLKRMVARKIPLRDIAYTLGMSGRRYTTDFKQLCVDAGIVTIDETIQEM